MDRVRRAGAAVALLGLLSGCGGPPPKPPTVLELTLVATPDVNPTDTGQGAPVMVRVYQLVSPAGFEKAEFFPLLNSDEKTLGPDLVRKDEYLLAPGQTRKETLTLPDRVGAVGVFAAFRQFQTGTWRVSIPVTPHATARATVTAGGAGLALK